MDANFSQILLNKLHLEHKRAQQLSVEKQIQMNVLLFANCVSENA